MNIFIKVSKRRDFSAISSKQALVNPWRLGMLKRLFVCLSISLSVCLSIFLFVSLSICLYIFLCVCLFICLFNCMFVCLFVCLYVCLNSSISYVLNFLGGSNSMDQSAYETVLPYGKQRLDIRPYSMPLRAVHPTLSNYFHVVYPALNTLSFTQQRLPTPNPLPGWTAATACMLAFMPPGRITVGAEFIIYLIYSGYFHIAPLQVHYQSDAILTQH